VSSWFECPGGPPTHALTSCCACSLPPPFPCFFLYFPSVLIFFFFCWTFSPRPVSTQLSRWQSEPARGPARVGARHLHISFPVNGLREGCDRHTLCLVVCVRPRGGTRRWRGFPAIDQIEKLPASNQPTVGGGVRPSPASRTPPVAGLSSETNAEAAGPHRTAPNENESTNLLAEYT